MAHRSLKVIETTAIQKLGCGFLFAFYSNYGTILYRSARYSDLLVENRELFIPQPVFIAPEGVTRRNFVKMFDADKTTRCLKKTGLL